MKERLVGQQLFLALKAAGFPVPDECRSAEIYMGVTDALTIRYECFITTEQLPLVSAAFDSLAKQRGWGGTDADQQEP